MNSNKKMPWNSSTKINHNELTSGGSKDIASRCQRLNYEQKIPQTEVTNRLKSLSQAINETAAENVVLGKDVASLMNTLGIEPQSLSREVKDGFDKVNAVLKNENLAEINETALAINMEQRKRDELLTSREDRYFKQKYDELCCHYVNLEKKLNQVQEKVSSLNELVSAAGLDNEIDYADMMHNAKKLNDYKKTCDNLDEELADMHLTDDYSDKILGKYKQCMQSTGELAEVNKFLNYYGYLPPDILEAKAYLEQLEKRRQETKRLLDEKLN